MKTNFFYLIFLLFVFSSCEKGDFLEDKTLTFGKFYGNCIGTECNTYYKLNSKKLYADKQGGYVAEENFKFEKLSDKKFKIAKPLLTEIPDELLALPDSTFGCPDCADQGGYYISYTEDGKTKTYKIDTFRDNVPEFLKPYLDELDEVMQLIE